MIFSNGFLGKYWVNTIPFQSATSPDHVALVVGFEPSSVAPHMAYDNKYYIRAGTHSESASHFIVEALRAKQVVQTPVLRATLRRSERKSRVVELTLVVLNTSVALDARISLEPHPKWFREDALAKFPLHIPFIDHQHPFSMELYYWGTRSGTFGDQPIELSTEYSDMLGNQFTYKQTIHHAMGIDPITMDNTDLEKIEQAIKEIPKKFDSILQTALNLQQYFSNASPESKKLAPPDQPYSEE